MFYDLLIVSVLNSYIFFNHLLSTFSRVHNIDVYTVTTINSIGENKPYDISSL